MRLTGGKGLCLAAPRDTVNRMTNQEPAGTAPRGEPRLERFQSTSQSSGTVSLLEVK